MSGLKPFSTLTEFRIFYRRKFRSKRFKPLITDVSLETMGDEDVNNPEYWKDEALDLGLVGVAVRKVDRTIEPPYEYRASIPQRMGVIG